MTANIVRFGYFLELSGLALALWGYRRTWKDVQPDESFAELILPLRRGWAALRRLLRRRPPVVGSVAAVGMDDSLEAYGYTPPTRLPEAGAGLAFAKAVQDNLDALARQHHEAEVRLLKAIDAARAETVGVKRRLTHRLDLGDKITHSRTVRGLREQVAGWVLFTIGLLMQIPAIF